MARRKTESLFDKLMGQLVKERDMLSHQISRLNERFHEIGEMFSRYGIRLEDKHSDDATPKAGKPRGRKGGRKGNKAAANTASPKPRTGSKRRGTRNRFALSGSDSVIAFIKKEGNPSTSEINAHWTAEGRAGSANTSITQLMKAGKLKRVKNAKGTGSRYTLA